MYMGNGCKRGVSRESRRVELRSVGMEHSGTMGIPGTFCLGCREGDRTGGAGL